MAKIDHNIGEQFTHDEHTYKVIEPTNKMANCHGCTFCRPETNMLHSECHIPAGLNGLRCSCPDRIFIEINN
jgi:hypothetical protein